MKPLRYSTKHWILRYNGLDERIERKVETEKVNRAKIKLRLRLLYYQLELVRKYFHELNNTFEMWYDISFNELVINDSKNLRFAIDDDILII